MTKTYDVYRLEDIEPYKHNPRKNDAAVEAVKESILQCGYIAPIVVDEYGVILAGHTRYKALKQLGFKNAEVVITSGLTDDQKRKYRLLDNKTGELADWDFDLLEQELKDLDFGDLGLDWGIPDDDEPEVADDDYEPEEPKDPKAKYGEVYKLGRHRLMCGDSTNPEDVKNLIGGGEATDLCLTDPPYGIGIVQNAHVGGGKIAAVNDYIPVTGDETTDTARRSYEIMKQYSRNQIIFGGNYFTDFLPPKSCWVVWDKQNTGNFADCELAWTSFDRAAKLYHWLWNGLSRKGDRKSEGISRVHPTQKPVGLMGGILKDFSKDGDKILDVFGGSGSTLIACEQLDRTCFMMELEPAYIDIIIDRWEKFTGGKAELCSRK